MAKKKPTKKEVEEVISGIINHLRFLDEKLNGIDGLFGLYLDWKKETDKFNKFVNDRVKEHRSQVFDNEPGEAK